MTEAENRKRIGMRLRQLRRNASMTPETVAEEIGCWAQAIRNYEKGKTMPNATRLAAFCQLYGVSSDVVLGLRDKVPRPTTETAKG